MVRQGRTVSRRLVDLPNRVSRTTHTFRVDDGAYVDIIWWQHFLSRWNGRSLILAGLNNGGGARLPYTRVWLLRVWCSLRYCLVQRCLVRPVFRLVHVHYELYPIFLTCFVWAPQWQHKCVLVRSDSIVGFQAIQSGWCRGGRDHADASPYDHGVGSSGLLSWSGSQPWD